MASFSQIKQDTKSVLEDYLQELDHFTEEQFAQSPGEGAWSAGQVYAHLTGSVKYYFLPNVLNCFQQQQGQIGGDKNEAGAGIFARQGYPDQQIKQPESLTSQGGPKAKTIAELKGALPQIILMLESAEVPEAAYNPDYKVHHAALGWLNAEEWLLANVWHWEHHKRQLARIKKALGISH